MTQFLFLLPFFTFNVSTSYVTQEEREGEEEAAFKTSVRGGGGGGGGGGKSVQHFFLPQIMDGGGTNSALPLIITSRVNEKESLVDQSSWWEETEGEMGWMERGEQT